MYFVKRGLAEVVRNEKVLHRFKEGDYFGEIALLSDTPRTADVRCYMALDPTPPWGASSPTLFPCPTTPCGKERSCAVPYRCTLHVSLTLSLSFSLAYHPPQSYSRRPHNRATIEPSR